MNKNNIVTSAALVTLMMLLFKIIGFVKQAVIAYYFGASVNTDIYFIAYGFIGGVSEIIIKSVSVSIISVYSFTLINSGKDKADQLISAVMEVMMPIGLLIVGLLCIFSPVIVKMIAPSYTSNESVLLDKYIHILSPLLLFAAIELVFGAVMDANKSFFLPRLQSLIYSVTIICACVFLSDWLSVSTLAIGEYVSRVLFSILLFITIRKYWSFNFVHLKSIPQLKKIVLTAIPLFVGNGVFQLNEIVDKAIASGLDTGTASALTYCHTLEQFVTNIMIVNIGNVIFAHFADYVSKQELAQISSILKTAINAIICILVPISIITIVCAEDIVAIVYYRGNFSIDALKLTSIALIGYAISFPAIGVRDLTVKSLYAFGDTTRPMRASIISIICNICLSILLSRFLGIFGISLATSISALIGMILNAYSLKIYLPSYSYKNHIFTLLRILPGTIILLILSLYITRLNFTNSSMTSFICTCIAGGSVYLLAICFSGIDEIRDLINYILHKK